MTDNKTLAYINLYAILGALPNLVDLAEEAKIYASPTKPIKLAINVNDGPNGMLEFNNGTCTFNKGSFKGDINMNCGSPERFNAVIEGANPPINLSIITGVKFLKGGFTSLTNLLTKYLRASEEDLKDTKFFNISTELMFYVIAEAIAAIGNNDKIGKLSAKRIPDGTISMEIMGGPSVCIDCNKGIMSVRKEKSTDPRAVMQFDSLVTARALFDGKGDAMTFIGDSKLMLKGYFPMLDNLNRILGRVADYLA